MNVNTVYAHISSICKQSYMQPKTAERVMRNNFKLTMEYQDKLWAKVTLERLFKSGVGTPDIQNLAKKQSLKSY